MIDQVLAVDLGGTQIRAALCTPSGRIKKRIAHLTRAHDGPDAVLERLMSLIAEALAGAGQHAVAGIGIGAPGPTNPSQGLLYEPPNLPGWREVPLRSMVHERFGLPAFLGNDANLAALAEYTYGAGLGVRDLVYLTISTGIGSGIIAGGRLLLGTNGLAGEAGHMVVVPDGPLCGCGSHGCLEALASGTGIARDVSERLAAGEASSLRALLHDDFGKLDARIISQAAEQGDELSRAAFRRAGHYLGLGIVNLLNLLNPRMVILGGSVTKAGALLFDPMQETIRRMAKPPYLKDLVVTPAALGDDVGILGAAALAVAELESIVREPASHAV